MKLTEVVARTDVGRVRDHNEDAYLILSDLGIFAVADGMGGLSHGEVASSTAINTLRSTSASLQTLMDSVDIDSSSQARRKLGEVLEFLSNMASERIRQALGQGVSGTTLVIGAVTRNHLLVCNTGDSRGYLYRDGRLYALTEDHTVAAAQLRAGVITPAEHDSSPYQHVLYQALGTQNEVDPDLFDVPLAIGDVILLCSDGLTGPVSEDAIEALLARHDSLEEAADALIAMANENGGPDNITLVLARAEAGRPADEAAHLHRSLADAPALSELSAADRRMLQLYLDLIDVTEPMDPAEGVYLLLNGTIRQGEQVLVPGEMMGLLPFADLALQEPLIEALEPTQLALLSQESFRMLQRRRPSIAAQLMHGLFRELACRLADASDAPNPGDLVDEVPRTLAPMDD